MNATKENCLNSAKYEMISLRHFVFTSVDRLSPVRNGPKTSQSAIVNLNLVEYKKSLFLAFFVF